MKKVFIICVLIGSLVINILALLGKEVILEDDYHVVVINAYSRGFNWTDKQVDALIKGFANSERSITVSIEYLDWKNYPDQENLNHQYELLKYKYSHQKIDVIIGTDDIGMQFAIDYQDEIFGSAPIVFTAVFEESAAVRMANTNNITGVYENTDSYGTLQLMFQFQPELENIYIIRDNSESAQGLSEEIHQALDEISPTINRIELNDKSYLEIREIISNPLEHSAIIFGAYTSDSKGFQMPDYIFCESYSQVSRIPMYSVYEHFFGYGIVGGSLLSGTKQGDKAVELTHRILNGEEASSISPVSAHTTYIGLDYIEFNRYQLNKKLIDYKTTTIINKPISLFEDYTEIVLLVVSIILLLFIIVIILIVNTSIKKKARQEIELSHDELKSANASLIDSERKLRKQNEALELQKSRINFLAYSDYLTGLPNRLDIKRYSEKLMQIIDREQVQMLLVFIDLDNFKYINTSYGHKAGDVLLEQIAERFNLLITLNSQLGRIGGDEFVYLAKVNDNDDILERMRSIVAVFEKEFRIIGKLTKVTASMGYAIYPTDATTYDELLVRADTAMFKMKSLGKSRVGRFDMDMDRAMTYESNITNELYHAIENQEFYMVYQPQLELNTGKIMGYECLIRWNSPKLGNIPPSDFIPIAEATGNIVPIGDWVLNQAIHFAKLINSLDENDYIVSINISVVELMQSDFVDLVSQKINKVGVNPQVISLEITESILIESFDLVTQKLKKLRSLGIKIALDDFGTGYSSLTYLKLLPIDFLKIDREFINGIIDEGQAHFFTASIIDIGHKLGFLIIAEGVEEEMQKEYLHHHGCHVIQGYWFSKPMEKDRVVEHLIEYSNIKCLV